MRAVITVTGKDRTGIIAKISNTLYEHQVNIIDISPVSYTHLTLPTKA